MPIKFYIYFIFITLLLSCRSGGKSPFGPPSGGGLNRSSVQEMADSKDQIEEVAEEIKEAAEKILEPIEIILGFKSARTFFQSRSVISLNLSSDFVKEGDTFYLTNETTGKNLVEPSQFSYGLALNSDEVENFKLQSGFDIQLNVYPLDPSNEGSIAYGENEFRLYVAKEDHEEYSKSNLNLGDFSVFQTQSTSFPTAKQSDQNFQGWIDPVMSTSVNNVTAKTKLTTGLGNMIND